VDEYRELNVTTVFPADVPRDPDPETLVARGDAESAEPLALVGMSRTISHAQRVTSVFETNPETLEVGGSSTSDFIRAVISTRMNCVRIDEQQERSVPGLREGSLAKGNVMCVKSLSG
jgi:hypothetical protein